MKTFLSSLIAFVVLLFLLLPAYPHTWRSTPPASVVSWKLLHNTDHTYGYDILVNDRITVHQPFIPCLRGNNGFSSQKDAARVARLMCGKIKKGIMPPTLTIEEMQAAGIRL